jgi:hypothetical protein
VIILIWQIFEILTNKIDMKRFFSIIRILIALCRRGLRIDKFDQLIFLTKIGHVIYELGGISILTL